MQKRAKIKINNQSGAAMLISVVFFLFISLAIISGLVGPTVREFKNSNMNLNSKRSYFLAESGNEDAFYRIMNNMTIPPSETITITLDSNSVTTTVDTLLGNVKQITSLGDVSNHQRKTNLMLYPGVGIAFNYGLQAGYGGFEMDNNSGVYGNVYANGNITGSNNTFITGSAIAANSGSMTSDQQNLLPQTPPNAINFRDISNRQDFAQSFQVSESSPINKVSFRIKKTGSPSNATIRIVTNSNGSPSTTNILSANGTLNSSQVGTSYGNVEVMLPSNPTLLAGVTYWLVIDSSSQNSSNYYTIAANSDYANGQAKVGQYSGAWNNTSPADLDGYFEIYLGGFTSTISNVVVGEGGVGDAYAHEVNGSTISGTLYCQTGSGNNKSCNTTLSDPLPQPFPVSDGNINTWKDEAEAGGIINGDYTPTGLASSLGPRKISGNLLIPGNHTLTLTGTVWVTGNLTIANGAKVKLSASYGNSSGVLLTDGLIRPENNVEFYGSGAEGSYLLLLTTSDCPNGAGCGGNKAVVLSNNVGLNSNQYIINAQKGTVWFSNNADVKSVIADRVHLSNNAYVHYDSGLADTNFSSGPSGGYTITEWKEVE